MSHAAFGKKIVAVDERASTKETQEFVHVLHDFVLKMSALMSSVPIWKYVSTKKWKDFENTTDKFLKFDSRCEREYFLVNFFISFFNPSFYFFFYLSFIGGYIQEAFRNIDSEELNNSVVKYMIENKEKYHITDEDIQSTLSELFTGGIETVI